MCDIASVIITNDKYQYSNRPDVYVKLDWIK